MRVFVTGAPRFVGPAAVRNASARATRCSASPARTGPLLPRATLRDGLKDGTGPGPWREFVGLYGPVVYGYARRRGLPDAAAAKLMQEVLRSVARAGRREYDPARGTFRGWLYTVTRDEIDRFLEGQRTRPRVAGDVADPDGPADGDGNWDREYRRQLSARAVERVEHEFQPNIWRAFWRTAVEGRPVSDVGAELGMTSGAVYVARSQVLVRLREEIQILQAEAEGR
jgi:RNA polymerase sigma-70 factor (ECF subfamily)